MWYAIHCLVLIILSFKFQRIYKLLKAYAVHTSLDICMCTTHTTLTKKIICLNNNRFIIVTLLLHYKFVVHLYGYYIPLCAIPLVLWSYSCPIKGIVIAVTSQFHTHVPDIKRVVYSYVLFCYLEFRCFGIRFQCSFKAILLVKGFLWYPC